MFVIIYALNEVVTILEVRVQKLLLWYKNEQLNLMSPFAYEVQIQRFKYLGVVFNFAFLLFSFFYLAIFVKFPHGIADSFQIFWESGIIFSSLERKTNYEHGAKFPLPFLVCRVIVLEKHPIYIYIYIYIYT